MVPWGQCCVRAPLWRNASMLPPPPFRLPAPTPGSAIEKGQLQSLTIGLKLAPPGISHQHHHWLLRVANTTTTATDDAGQPGWTETFYTSTTVFRCLRHKLIPVTDLINPSCSRQSSRKNNYCQELSWPSLFFFFRILPAEYNTGGCRSSRARRVPGWNGLPQEPVSGAGRLPTALSWSWSLWLLRRLGPCPGINVDGKCFMSVRATELERYSGPSSPPAWKTHQHHPFTRRPHPSTYLISPHPLPSPFLTTCGPQNIHTGISTTRSQTERTTSHTNVRICSLLKLGS